MTVPILPPPNHFWYCPKCHQEDVTHEVRPHARMHACPRTFGLSVTFVAVGTKAKIETKEREDYIGNDVLVRLAPETGRPVEQIVTTRDQGQDTIVFAPTAIVRLG